MLHSVSTSFRFASVFSSQSPLVSNSSALNWPVARCWCAVTGYKWGSFVSYTRLVFTFGRRSLFPWRWPPPLSHSRSALDTYLLSAMTLHNVVWHTLRDWNPWNQVILTNAFPSRGDSINYSTENCVCHGTNLIAPRTRIRPAKKNLFLPKTSFGD